MFSKRSSCAINQGYRVIDFEDDNLTYYKSTFKELCRRLIERFPNREMQFVAMNGISYLSLDEELLELMFQAGFSHLNLALVSSDKTVRETTKRPHTLEAYLKIVHKAARLGIQDRLLSNLWDCRTKAWTA